MLPCPRIAQRAAKRQRASVKMCLLTNGRKQNPFSKEDPWPVSRILPSASRLLPSQFPQRLTGSEKWLWFPATYNVRGCLPPSKSKYALPAAVSDATRWSILLPFSSVTLEAPNERWKPFMSISSPGQMRSWHSSGEIACQHARRSAAFSPRWIRQQSSRCAPCFSQTCWRALWKKRSS